MADSQRPLQTAGAKDNEQARETLRSLGTALQVGALSGIGGLLAGSVGGILKSTEAPTLFAVASGIQWFALGTTFSAARQMAVKSYRSPTGEPMSPVIASAIAGASAGGVGGALRSRRNILPGILFFGAAGAIGQKVMDSRTSLDGAKDEKDLHGSWINSKWSPVKVLSDDEYEKLLQEKMLRVDADIAIVDENIEAVRRDAAAHGKGVSSAVLAEKIGDAKQ